jgi:hypothetical protein
VRALFGRLDTVEEKERLLILNFSGDVPAAGEVIIANGSLKKVREISVIENIAEIILE